MWRGGGGGSETSSSGRRWLKPPRLATAQLLELAPCGTGHRRCQPPLEPSLQTSAVLLRDVVGRAQTSAAHILTGRRHSIVSFGWLSRCRWCRFFTAAAMGKCSHGLRAGSGRMPRKKQQQRRRRQKTNTETGTQRTSARRAVKMMDEDSSSSMLSMMVSNISVGNNVSLAQPALPTQLPSDG